MAGLNPFGDDPDLDPYRHGPIRVIRNAAAQLERLRGQVGPDGLSPATARTLLDEVSKALRACAEAFDQVQDGTEGQP
jgi:hypothetical protein